MARIHLTTRLGDFSFVLLEHRAPRMCAYYKKLVQKRAYKNASVFRIVSEKNHALYELPPIKVIQIGPENCIENRHDAVAHESTRETGLAHLKWTVSAARIELNKLFGSFFICMRDEPELDFGGSRQPDGQGFSAFGRVDEGYDALDRIYSRAEPNDWLSHEIPIESVSLIEN